MTHHISHVVLLPQGAGWEWYDALHDYMLRFRPTVTQSADDAVSFHGKSHTVTVVHPASWNRPGVARAPGQAHDIVAWLRDPKNTGSARFDIDVIEESDPVKLKRLLSQRVLETARFGKIAPVPGAPVTASPQPTPPTPAKVTATATDTLNVREGPGTDYSRPGAIAAGTTYDVVGRSQDNAWLQIPYPNANSRGWISASFATVNGNLASVAVVSAPPAPDTSQQKLTLVWPSDYKVYTQRFGERPEYYGKFGLPGHEGVDIRAPNGANIYACADGVVTLAGWRSANHPYGYSVRLRHKRVDGEYETIYAHLTEGSAKVAVGDSVKAGQLIALADNTGNSSAAHLHLSLKKIGAKNGGYGEIIDPAPFFVNGP